jgi:outer membrane protein OmpA-like peptidoglycan-associated protein
MGSKTRNSLFVIAGIAAFLSGCETLDPYTGESETSKATKGALIGAAAGVVAGLMSGDDAVERRQHALIGAGVGALAGGAVGHYMDQQEAKLRAELQGTGVSVTFDTDSSALRPQFFSVLNSVGKVLTEYDKTVVEVAGHTDSTGSDSYNLQLSQRRANTVGEYLYTQGIMDQRIISVGMGEHHPIADNSTPEGRQLNRRVEITLVPVTAS